jgi:hypothetical protein
MPGGTEMSLTFSKQGFESVTAVVSQDATAEVRIVMETSSQVVLDVLFPNCTEARGEFIVECRKGSPGGATSEQSFAMSVREGHGTIRLSDLRESDVDVSLRCINGRVTKRAHLTRSAQDGNQATVSFGTARVIPCKCRTALAAYSNRDVVCRPVAPVGGDLIVPADADGIAGLMYLDSDVSQRVQFSSDVGASPVLTVTRETRMLDVELGAGGGRITIVTREHPELDISLDELATSRTCRSEGAIVNGQLTFRVPIGAYRVSVSAVPIPGAVVVLGSDGAAETLDLDPYLATGSLRGTLKSSGQLQMWLLLDGRQIQVEPARTVGLSASAQNLLPGRYAVVAVYDDGTKYSTTARIAVGEDTDVGELWNSTWIANTYSIVGEDGSPTTGEVRLGLLPLSEWPLQERRTGGSARVFAPPQTALFVGIRNGFALTSSAGASGNVVLQLPEMQLDAEILLPAESRGCTQLLVMLPCDMAVWFIEVPRTGDGLFGVPSNRARQYYFGSIESRSAWFAAVPTGGTPANAEEGEVQRASVPSSWRSTATPVLLVDRIEAHDVRPLEFSVEVDIDRKTNELVFRLPRGICGRIVEGLGGSTDDRAEIRVEGR